MSNYCPKSKKLNPWPPKPRNIDIGQSFPTSGSIESLKKSPNFATLLLSIFAKVYIVYIWSANTLVTDNFSSGFTANWLDISVLRSDIKELVKTRHIFVFHNIDVFCNRTFHSAPKLGHTQKSSILENPGILFQNRPFHWFLSSPFCLEPVQQCTFIEGC